MAKKKIAALLFLFVVSKIMLASAFFPLYVRCLVPLPPSPKTDFSGFALMRPSHRFHGDSHKTVRFPVLKRRRKKNLQWGCSPNVRDAASKSVVISFRR